MVHPIRLKKPVDKIIKTVTVRAEELQLTAESYTCKNATFKPALVLWINNSCVERGVTVLWLHTCSPLGGAATTIKVPMWAQGCRSNAVEMSEAWWASFSTSNPTWHPYFPLTHTTSAGCFHGERRSIKALRFIKLFPVFVVLNHADSVMLRKWSLYWTSKDSCLLLLRHREECWLWFLNLKIRNENISDLSAIESKSIRSGL